MSAISDFIFSKEGNQKEILEFFHNFLTTEIGLDAKIRYKIPFYFDRSWICYLNPYKNDQIELAFLRGNELSNAQGILDFRDRKQVSGIVLSSLKDCPMDLINEVLQEAILLDETVPYNVRKK